MRVRTNATYDTRAPAPSTSEEETSMRVPRTTQMNHRTMRARPDNAKQTGEVLEKFAESAGGRDGGSHMRLPVGARAPWHASVCARAPAILNISRSLVGRCPFCPALCVRTRRTHGTQSHSVQISDFWICFYTLTLASTSLHGRLTV